VTTFDLTLQQDATVSAEVFDVGGHRVRTLDIGHVGAGASQLQFDGLGDRSTPLPSGVYFLRIRAAGETVTRKMVITH
jgi:flagellar hook assembly protein FlgD